MGFFGRTRPFWAAFFLTLCLLGTAAGMLTVDYRCRMMTDPVKGTAAGFEWDSALDGDGYLKLVWFGTEREFRFGTGEPLRVLSEAMPVVIPGPLRAAALLQTIRLPQEVSAALDEIFSP